MDREKIIAHSLSIIGVWLLLQVIILPFNYSTIPQLGVEFHWLILPLTEGIYQLFGEWTIPDPTVSDSISSYIWAALLFCVSISASFLLRKLRYRISISGLEQILLLILSFFLMRYGIDKVLGNQFFAPEANILYSDVGSISKDMLFWTSMGTSSIYNQFLGWCECIVGVMLLFKRTRKLALLGSAAIFLNVFFLNIGFNISVKYLSGLLLLISLWLNASFLHNKELNQSKSWGKYILGLILVLELITSSLKTLANTSSEYSGTYQAIQSSDESLPASTLLHIHSKGYLIVQRQNEFKSHEIFFKNDEFSFRESDSITYTGSIKQGRMSLSNNKGKIVAIQLKEYHPLLKDVTNWTVESFAY